MTPEMHNALTELSLFYDPDPDVVCRRVVEIVGAFYPRASAMITVAKGKRVVLREAVNLHPSLQGYTSLSQHRTYCVYVLRDGKPLLLQDAAEHPECCNNRAVTLGLRRYLGVPIRDSVGAIIGTLCFLDDCIEEKLGEDDVQFLSILAMRVSVERERERIIAERIAEHQANVERVEHLNAQLQIAAEEKRRFVSMVIHDLRHPLTTLRTVLYLLQSETEPEYIAEHCGVIENRVAALSSLLEELVHYNALEDGGSLPLQCEDFEIAPFVRECLAGFAPAFLAQCVALEYVAEPTLETVCSDKPMLTHILNNLLANALKYTPRGSVTIKTGRDEAERWYLEVADTGIGISPEMQDKIFEEYRRDPANADRPGAGLGLAIVRRLCETLGAELTFESMPHIGTCFRIRFREQG
jgi:signal transduction histidine kinase